MCSAFSRIASKPPAMRGLMVFTRPSRISGNPVKSETSRTEIPFAARSREVPPVEMISTRCAANAFANSTIPVLSYTLMSARSIRLTEVSRLFQIAVGGVPDMPPDIGHIGNGMRKRDRGNSELRRNFDSGEPVGQFSGSAQPVEQVLPFCGSRLEESVQVSRQDQVVVPVKHDRKILRLG